MDQNSDPKQSFKLKYINQVVRVKCHNKRVFRGKLKAVDFRGNLVLYETVAEIPPEQNCPVNLYLQNALDSKLTLPDPGNLSEQELKNVQREYIGSHYYIGAAIISTNDIAKIQMKYPPIQEPEPQQSTQTIQKKQEPQTEEQNKEQNTQNS